MRRDILLLTIALTALYVGCKKNTVQTEVTPISCDGIDSRFSAKVFPIIQGSCATNIGCHGNGSINGPGALISFTQISNASTAIKSAVSSGIMPKNSTLGTPEKNAIICWVNSGSPNN